MAFQYDTEKLQEILRSLSVLTGISLEFLDVEERVLCKSFNENAFCRAIQQDPARRRNCARSDRALLKRCSQSRAFEHHICHAGLYDACMPIVKDSRLAGYVLMGQLRTPRAESTPYPILCDLYEKVPLFTEEQIAAIQKLLPEILFQGTVSFDGSAAEVADFIAAHLAEDLSLPRLCKEFHLSKNTLYQSFHDTYGCTVNAYITKCRLERAKALLPESRDPIYAVAEQVGLPNPAYFCRLFKKHFGVTPASYRKNGEI